MKLHDNPKLFDQAVRITADRKKIPAIYIEKDYWVTYALKLIFTHPKIAAYAVFKGGTALSKCYRMIERFSEDIDLVVLQEAEESNSARDRKVKSISKLVTGKLPEIAIGGLTNKRGMIRKTAHTYHKNFEGSYGQVREVIVLEATWFGHSEPWGTEMLASYIYEEMEAHGQLDRLAGLEMEPFEIKVLDPRRTLCEKIMSLVRFSYGTHPIGNLQDKIRHTYDLHQMLQHPKIQQFFVSDDFDAMLLRVGHEDAQSFRSNNQWLQNHPGEAMLFRDLTATWEQLEQTYQRSFQQLVYGEFPEPEKILASLERIKARLDTISWDIRVGKP